jgi:hypothetical protein
MKMLIGSVGVFVVAASAAPTPAFAGGDEPELIVGSIFVRAIRGVDLRTKVGGPETHGTWTWIPQIQFEVVGPIPDGSVYVAEFAQGKSPWVTLTMKDWAEANTNYPRKTRILQGGYETAVRDAQLGSTSTGKVSFQIRYKNELTSVDKIVFKGTFTVGKMFVKDEARYKNTFEYYVDYDANMPLGYYWINPTPFPDSPPLYVSMWFRGKGKATAHLIYKDKPICKDENGGASDSFEISVGPAQYHVARYTFTFSSCAPLTAAHPEFLPTNAHVLSKNPGDYEIKIMQDGKVTRTAKLAIGADGNIVDIGMSGKTPLGAGWMVLPVKVLSTGSEGGEKFDASHWKTDAMFGNVPDGFKAP